MCLKIFKVELSLGKPVKIVKSNKDSEYYKRYDDIRRNLVSFAKLLLDCSVYARYTISSTHKQNGVIEMNNYILLYMVWCILSNFSLP